MREEDRGKKFFVEENRVAGLKNFVAYRGFRENGERVEVLLD